LFSSGSRIAKAAAINKIWKNLRQEETAAAKQKYHFSTPTEENMRIILYDYKTGSEITIIGILR
tara:strand:+ start:265 stop:456 length:192 start_codon:yes stop_codon:yes gene_type:complete